MIKRASEVPFNEVYETFMKGFSDYLIPIKITEDQFKNHFFGQEGNSLNHSFLYYDSQPIGLVLGGIKVYEGVKTIRCGTMCVIPSERGKGYARKLLSMHVSEGIEHGCKLGFLECIESNKKALDFYRKSNYFISNHLKYYTLTGHIDTQEIGQVSTLEMVLGLGHDYHINWQNDFDYLKEINPNVYIMGKNYVIYKNNKIYQLYVSSCDRGKGIGKGLVRRAHEDLSKPLKISFPSNGHLESFLIHLGFLEDNIRQVEMYTVL